MNPPIRAIPMQDLPVLHYLKSFNANGPSSRRKRKHTGFPRSNLQGRGANRGADGGGSKSLGILVRVGGQIWQSGRDLVAAPKSGLQSEVWCHLSTWKGRSWSCHRRVCSIKALYPGCWKSRDGKRWWAKYTECFLCLCAICASF